MRGWKDGYWHGEGGPQTNGAFVPLGQNSEAEWDPKEVKEHKKKWGFDVVSFEVWAAATCFDVEGEKSDKTGGVHFQRIMHWALTEQAKSAHKAEQSLGGEARPIKHWDANAKGDKRYIGDHWEERGGTNKKPVRDKRYASRDMKSARGSGGEGHEWPFTDASYAQSRIPGGRPGYSTNQSMDAGFDSEHGLNHVKNVLISKPFATNGKAMFMYTAGLAVDQGGACKGVVEGKEGKAGPNLDVQWVMKGNASAKDQMYSPERGCVPMSLLLAAYYGLYYYPGCDRGDWNWEMQQTVGDKTFRIRMRMPNPAFRSSGTALVVNEPLNAKYVLDKELQQKGAQRNSISNPINKGRVTFTFPRLSKEGTDRRLTWDYLGERSKEGVVVSAITSFASDEKGSLKWVQNDRANHEHHDEMHAILKGSKWEGRFFKRGSWSEGAFGWTPPAALFLYPHMGGAKEATNDKGKYPQYQPWPKLAAKDAFKTWGPGKPLMKLFKPLPPKAENRQLVALGEKAPNLFNAEWKEVEAMLGGEKVVSPDPDPVSIGEARRTHTKTPKDGPTRQKDTSESGVTGEVATNDLGVQDTYGVESWDQFNAAQMNEGNEADTGQGSLEAGWDFGGVTLEQSYIEDKVEGEDDVGVMMQAGVEVRGFAALDQANVLEFGSARRIGDRGNFHFFDLNHSPWAPTDVYTRPTHEYIYGEMDEDAQNRYERLYGNMANTLLRHDRPHEITGVKNTFGEVKTIGKKSILEMRLDSYRDKSLTKDERDVFRKNMRRVLSVYHDTSGPLGKTKGVRIDVEGKRNGMLYGTWGSKRCDKVSCTTGVGKPPSSAVQLLPPVFGEKKGVTKALINKIEAMQSYVTTAEGHLLRGEQTLEEQRDAIDVDGIVASMTVLEWLQTPWHYEYLPYQPAYSVFKDGETYCAGCTRCSRPFFEYPTHYAHYVRSVPGTQHWPNSYWRKGKKGDVDMRDAPLPFHDPAFWSDATVPNTVNSVPGEEVAGADKLLDEGERGFHNWRTRVFLLGYVKTSGEHPVRKAKGESCSAANPLCEEWTKRRGLMKVAYEAGHWWTFREYINHTYDPKADYYNLVQGAMRSKRSSVAYGMRGYRLMRSVKYGNTCRDCAFTLDVAPKLYIRAGKTTADITMLQSAQHRPEKQTDTFWLGLRDQKLSDGEGFDPWFIYLNTSQDRKFHHTGTPGMREVGHRAQSSRAGVMEALDLHDDETQALMDSKKNVMEKLKLLWGGEAEKKFDMHMAVVEKYNHGRHCSLSNADGPLTKVVSCTVNAQKTWSKGKSRLENEKAWADGDEKKIKGAVDVMETFLEWLQKLWKGEPTTDAPPITAASVGEYNRALFDLLRDAQFEMSRQHAYSLDPDTNIKKFDSNMVRMEWRNWTVKDEHGEWKNCLRVKTLQQPHAVDVNEPRRDAKTGRDYFAPEEAFNTVIYRCNRKGELGKDTEVPEHTEWRGDGWLTELRKDGTWTPRTNVTENSEVSLSSYQVRKYTQSRLFITYSLHRRIQSQEEARHVMEKMANAARCLFGNDRWLCEIINFGVRVKGGTQTDTVASKHLTFIDKPRKETTRFYGGTDGNSYLFDTYQTHVESVDCDVGVEIGPTYHMPHFHALVTINHWSYVQIDTMRMRSLLEQMFKGTGRFQGVDEFKLDTKLFDNAGLPFYTDNENPYVDIRLYPSDNWDEVIRAYVRKTTQPGILEAQRTRMGS